MSFLTNFAALQIPRPDPVPQAGPSWLFNFLLLLTFFLHILPMNLVLGGSILVFSAKLKGRKSGCEHYRELSRTLSRMLPVSVAYAITFGVATLLFAQILYGRLLYTSSILVGWYWFSLIPILILAYYGTYMSAFREKLSSYKGLWVSGLTAALFGVIAFIFSNNMSLMLHPETFLSRYSASPGGFSLNLTDATLLPRYLHMVVGALAVTGLFVAVIGLMRRPTEREFGIWATRRGVGLFAGATALNLILGTWFLLSFSRKNLLEFVRSEPAGVAALALGILFGLSALGCGVLALQTERVTALVSGTAVALLLTLVSMIVTRDRLRQAVLSSIYEAAPVEVSQWGLILTFFLVFSASLLAIGWMLKQLRHSLSPDGNRPKGAGKTIVSL
jgi:hypothetical protein